MTVVTNVKLSDIKTPSQNKAMLESLFALCFVLNNIQPSHQNTFWYVSAKPKMCWNFMFVNAPFYISLWSQHCVCALVMCRHNKNLLRDRKNIIIWLKMPVSVNTLMHGDGHCSCQNYYILLQQKWLKNVQGAPKKHLVMSCEQMWKQCSPASKISGGVTLTNVETPSLQSHVINIYMLI